MMNAHEKNKYYILVIGGTGFVGKSLIKMLLSKNYNVICVGRREEYKEDHKNFLYFKNTSNLYKALSEFNIHKCVNLSWSGTSGKYRSDFNEQFKNIKNNELYLEIIKKLNVKFYYNIGSVMEYEIFYDMLNEQPQKNKIYGLAKYNDHYISKVFCDENSIKYTNLIITNTYGPGEKSQRLVLSIIKNYFENIEMSFSKCNQWYSFQYIDDLCDSIINIMKDDNPKSKYILGDCKPKRLKKYITEIYKALNNKYKKNLYPKFSNIVQNSIDKKYLLIPKYNKKVLSKTINFHDSIIKTAESYLEVNNDKSK